MGDTSIISDTAYATAQDIVRVFANLLRDEELPDAFHEVLEHVKAGLKRYAVLRDRERLRLHGSPAEN